jgi:hypothetical protein
MRKKLLFAAALSMSAAFALPAAPAMAQQLLGYDNWGRAICSGPLGPGPCEDVHRYIQQQQLQPMGGPGMAGLPGAGMLTQDGQLVASIAEACRGEPRCMAAAWGSVEIQRCRNGIGTPGGCFGPNGEIMRVVNNVLPENLRPTTIIENIQNDIANGPGPNNEICRLTPFC